MLGSLEITRCWGCSSYLKVLFGGSCYDGKVPDLCRIQTEALEVLQALGFGSSKGLLDAFKRLPEPFPLRLHLVDVSSGLPLFLRVALRGMAADLVTTTYQQFEHKTSLHRRNRRCVRCAKLLRCPPQPSSPNPPAGVGVERSARMRQRLH